MKKDNFNNLDRGDIVKHKEFRETYVVTANYGSYVVAVNTVHMSNSSEWDLLLKANHERINDRT